MNSPYIYPKQAVAYLGMTGKWAEKILLRWFRQGRIRGGRVGRTPVFTIEQLDAFVASGGRRR